MNYPYANGRIAAIDNDILDRTQLSKLLKTSKSDFVATLVDLGYGNNTDGNLEDLINREISDTKVLLDEISPQKEFTDLFYLENDLINIKAIYKMKIFGYDNFSSFKSLGIFSREQVEKIILSNNFEGLSPEYKSLFTDINKVLEGIDNPRLISAKIDNAVYRFLLKILKKHQNPILKQYFQFRIDTANILTIIRAKRLGWEVEQCGEMFIDHGLISIEDLTKAFYANDLSKMFTTYYQGKLDNGLKGYHDNDNVNRLEMYFDELILELMANYRYEAFSIGPIVYYFLKKQAEAKNIRLIYANDNLDINDLLRY